jgi:hypothetical protein
MITEFRIMTESSSADSTHPADNRCRAGNTGRANDICQGSAADHGTSTVTGNPSDRTWYASLSD